MKIYPTLRSKVKEKKQSFYCCSSFHSHSRVFHNELTLVLKWAWNGP